MENSIFKVSCAVQQRKWRNHGRRFKKVYNSFKVQDLKGFFPKNFTQKQMTDTILKLLYEYNRKLERRRNSRDER